MRKACLKSNISIESTKIHLFPDLSRCTLQLRATLSPILAALQIWSIPYRWGYPFALHVRHNDVSAIFFTPSNLPLFSKNT